MNWCRREVAVVAVVLLAASTAAAQQRMVSHRSVLTHRQATVVGSHGCTTCNAPCESNCCDSCCIRLCLPSPGSVIKKIGVAICGLGELLDCRPVCRTGCGPSCDCAVDGHTIEHSFESSPPRPMVDEAPAAAAAQRVAPPFRPQPIPSAQGRRLVTPGPTPAASPVARTAHEEPLGAGVRRVERQLQAPVSPAANDNPLRPAGR